MTNTADPICPECGGALDWDEVYIGREIQRNHYRCLDCEWHEDYPDYGMDDDHPWPEEDD